MKKCKNKIGDQRKSYAVVMCGEWDQLKKLETRVDGFYTQVQSPPDL